MSSVVARRYARALADIGRETGTLDQMVEQLSTFGTAFEASTELRNALESPLVALDAKRAIVKDIAAQIGADDATRNALLLLTDRRRIRILPAVAKLLREMNDARKGIVRADVTTAVRLSDAYYEKLKTQLERMTGKRVVLDTKEDPNIIGGVIARIGDTIIDGSLRSRLDEMKNNLLNRQPKQNSAPERASN